jgi:hypothetical protein
MNVPASVCSNAVGFAASVAISLASAVAAPDGSAYDLSRTDGMNCFGGSDEAATRLAAQGFVVAAPSFAQMFEPYIRCPLPVFVTPDSAWHTYHVLLEQGLKNLERAQSARLAEFSRLLLNAAESRSKNGPPVYNAIAHYASTGLAFQDHAHRAALPEQQRTLLEALLHGGDPVEAPIGFPLSPGGFRPQSFYIETEELADYYAARQWYACVDFRLSDERETLSALCLASLVEAAPRLRDLWRQLSSPYDSFVAPAEDATVILYQRVAKAVLGPDEGFESLQAQLSSIRERLDAELSAPRINDQVLSPAEYARFPNATKGFRLLPPRQLPCAVCFQGTVEPAIPGRSLPSGLDFLAASPVMRSPAAMRAVETQFGADVARAVAAARCPPMPDSLYGRSMELLATLQEKLPDRMAQPLRTEAWADLQLWTQLGAWSEQRHTWALYAKNGTYYMGELTGPPGVVAPYPGFFKGLSKLSLATAEALTVPGLVGFSGTCDRLAELAQKQLAGEAPTLEDVRWLRDYGMVLAHYHGYEGNSWLHPLDDFSLITRIFEDGTSGSTLYAGVARPQALYVILPHKNRLQLYRGAVLSYREFPRPAAQPLNDKSWRELVQQHRAPAPPAFTSSFLRTDDPTQGRRRNPASSASGPPPPPAKIKLSVQTTDLGPKPARWVRREGWISPSEDCRHVAYREQVGEKWRIVRDGVPGKEYDNAEYQFFSQDSRHLAYLARAGEKQAVVLDGVEGGWFSKIDEIAKDHWPIEFSPDSAHLAYIGTAGERKQCVVVDGKEGPIFEEVLFHSFSFSGDSKHFAYAGRRGGHCFVIKDGKELLKAKEVLSPVDHVGGTRMGDTFGPFLSANGSRLACATGRQRKWVVNVEGVESRPWEMISDLDLDGVSARFSPDGRHFSYVGERGEKRFVVIDQKEIKDGGFYCAVFSPDSKHTAYVRAIEPEQGNPASWVVLDGNPGKKFTGEIKDLTFSPDGRKLVYKVAEHRGTEYVVVHGGETFEDYYAQGDFVFSPDSRHLAFLGSRNGARVFVVDGEDQPRSDDGRSDLHSNEFTFSPDSQRWGFLRRRSGKQYAVISGLEYGPYDWLGVPDEEEYIYFGPDSRHFAYMAVRGTSRTNYWGNQYLVVDGLEYEIQGAWLTGSFLRFDSGTKLHGLVIGEKRIFLLEAQISDQ